MIDHREREFLYGFFTSTLRFCQCLHFIIEDILQQLNEGDPAARDSEIPSSSSNCRLPVRTGPIIDGGISQEPLDMYTIYIMIVMGELKILANKKDVPYQSLAKVYLARQIALERSS